MASTAGTRKRTQGLPGCKKPVKMGRHAAECKICAHADRSEIEQEFVGWAGANRKRPSSQEVRTIVQQRTLSRETKCRCLAATALDCNP